MPSKGAKQLGASEDSEEGKAENRLSKSGGDGKDGKSKERFKSRMQAENPDDPMAGLNIPKKKRPFFIDPEKMKKKLRENVNKPRYDVSDYYWETGVCRDIATNDHFQNLTLFVITLNALWLSIDTDNNTADTLATADVVWVLGENFFCFYFTFEWAVRTGAFKNKLNGFKDAWYTFDTFMVAMMVAETWVLFTLMKVAGVSGTGGNTSLLKLLKLLRLSRMARMARLLRSMPELLILIKGMLAAVRTVSVTLLLLVLLIYVFGVYFRQMGNGTAAGDAHFYSMAASMHNLLLYGIFCDSVTNIVADFEAEIDGYALLFPYYIFMLMGSITVMNMLIGVLCEVISAVATVEQEEMTIHFAKEQLLEIIKKYEAKDNPDDAVEVDECSYQLSKETFLALFMQPETAGLLAEIDVDAVGLVDIVDTLFIDADGNQIILSFGEMVGVMLDQRSSNVASVKDLTNIRKYLRDRFEKLEDLGDDVHEQLEINSCRRTAQCMALGKMLCKDGSFEKQREQRYQEMKAEVERKKAEKKRLMEEQLAKEQEEMERLIQEKMAAVKAAAAASAGKIDKE